MARPHYLTSSLLRRRQLAWQASSNPFLQTGFRRPRGGRGARERPRLLWRPVLTRQFLRSKARGRQSHAYAHARCSLHPARASSDGTSTRRSGHARRDAIGAHVARARVRLVARRASRAAAAARRLHALQVRAGHTPIARPAAPPDALAHIVTLQYAQRADERAGAQDVLHDASAVHVVVGALGVDSGRPRRERAVVGSGTERVRRRVPYGHLRRGGGRRQTCSPAAVLLFAGDAGIHSVLPA